ncbi:MAG: hypothetical protein JWQ89_3377 [Devosia sp.]|nr:hypothetical protein [Devosia sp.]
MFRSARIALHMVSEVFQHRGASRIYGGKRLRQCVKPIPLVFREILAKEAADRYAAVSVQQKQPVIETLRSCSYCLDLALSD